LSNGDQSSKWRAVGTQREEGNIASCPLEFGRLWRVLELPVLNAADHLKQVDGKNKLSLR